MLEEYLRIAKDAATKAGDFLAKRECIHIDSNFERDIKLNSDKNSENLIINCLNESKLPILSEECGLTGSLDGLHWIVDPLDGTVNYYRGIDELCCVSIALFNGNEPMLGVINRFLLNELYSSLVGQGSKLNGVPIMTSGIRFLKDSILATGFPAGMDFSDESIMNFTRRVQRAKKIRMLGSAALMAAFVACGRVDIYFEQDIRLWDVAGAMAIIKAAGGAVTLCNKDSEYKYDFGAFATESLMEEFYVA